MPVELNAAATKELDFTLNGKQVSTKKIPFGLAVQLYSKSDDSGSAEITEREMARVLVKCVTYTESGERVWGDEDIDEILEKDSAVMMALFQEVSSFSSPDLGEAEKN